jgi:hypothetical protein
MSWVLASTMLSESGGAQAGSGPAGRGRPLMMGLTLLDLSRIIQTGFSRFKLASSWFGARAHHSPVPHAASGRLTCR